MEIFLYIKERKCLKIIVIVRLYIKDEKTKENHNQE